MFFSQENFDLEDAIEAGMVRDVLSKSGDVAGFVDRNGNLIRQASILWSEFLAITPAMVANEAVAYIRDKHCLFIWNALASRWFHIGGRLVFDDFTQPPAPTAKWEGLECWVKSGIGIGGAAIVIRKVGTDYLWRYKAGRAALKLRISDISKTTNKTTEEALEGFLLPRNNGKSIMQNGDILMLAQYASKSGTANNFGRDFRIGPNGPGANILLDASVGDAVATGSGSNISDDEVHRFKRISATSFKKMGPKYSVSNGGFTASARSAAVPIADMDFADTYFSSTFWLSGGTADTQTLEDWYLELIHTAG